MTRLIAALLAAAALLNCGGTTPPSAEVRRREPAALQTAAPLQLARETVTWSGGTPHRNLFAFPAAPRPRIAKAIPASIAPVVVPQPSAVVVAAEPEPAPFPYRYIGSFGPRDDLFAAFVRDGEVINVRAGETIGSGFRLVRIGIESVEVSDGGRMQRVSPSG